MSVDVTFDEPGTVKYRIYRFILSCSYCPPLGQPFEGEVVVEDEDETPENDINKPSRSPSMATPVREEGGNSEGGAATNGEERTSEPGT